MGDFPTINELMCRATGLDAETVHYKLLPKVPVVKDLSSMGGNLIRPWRPPEGSLPVTAQEFVDSAERLGAERQEALRMFCRVTGSGYEKAMFDMSRSGQGASTVPRTHGEVSSDLPPRLIPEQRASSSSAEHVGFSSGGAGRFAVGGRGEFSPGSRS